jgi:formate hydrogenlyase transcriptional activator
MPTLELARQRIHTDDLGLFEERLRHGPQEGKDFEFEHRLVVPGGAVKHVHVVARAVRDESGTILEFLGAVMDVTAQRRAQQALRAAKARFEGVLEIADDAIISVDSHQRIVLFNHGAERVFGYTATEVMGELLDTLLPPRFQHVHRDHIEAFAQSPEVSRSMGQRREVYGRRKDGREFPAEASISKLDVGGELVFTVILRDITDRKRAEEELRRSEAYLAEAQRLSRTGSFGWKVSCGELFWSEETFCILGYDQGTTPALELVFQRVHPEDIASLQQTIDRASHDGTDLDLEHRLLMPDGSVKHVRVVAHAVRDDTDALEFVGAVSDITATKMAEERIRQDERELRQIVEAIPELILVLAPDGSSLYANERVLEYTGLSLEDVQAGDFRERVFHPSDVERVRDERQEALARGVPFQLEQRARAKDGRYRWFLTHYNPLRDEQGRILRWYATGTDIDDRKRAEERVQRENLALREEIDNTSMFEEIVGASRALRAVLGRVAKVAPTDSTVLITGETGTGKELVARAIHRRSPRASGAFVSVNCAAVPPALLASELFGHEKGAFTGAAQRRLGRFELAEGGTLFLDEIGELPAETQVTLLRVLQEREFERVGGAHAIRADVRVIAAANRDLQAAIAAGDFRSDLFYRLNVFPIEMPPLRDRPEDIPLLVEYFIDRYARKAGKRFRGVNRKTLELLQAYPWPGNIRELQNVIERSVIVCEPETFSVDESWLSRDTLSPQLATPTLSRRSVAQEKDMIEAALAETRGRVAGPSGAAARLGLPPSTLESKIRSLKINKHRFKVP